MSQLENIINDAFEQRLDLTPANVSAEIRAAVTETLNLLDQGSLRVAEKIDGDWVTHQWLKKAVLLSFRINENRLMDGGNTRYYDKVECKYSNYTEEDFAKAGVRVVPNSVARHGSYIAPGAILMPSYVNIGAYVGSGTMVDTWVTVGSCAQIGQNVHHSGGVGSGGVTPGSAGRASATLLRELPPPPPPPPPFKRAPPANSMTALPAELRRSIRKRQESDDER